ncbi:hypothetical protein [Ferroplasma sp.]|jgi:hypothetical protein|uniref:hypothetical protein n=1 Tax=Ferroplasma sp. TaxID=2591003 RepID=UPI002621CFFB|nr:hypothetical protein [Ferroplasma sp.]
MGFIGEIIGGVIGAIISGIIAIYVSRNSIKQERKEIYEEKLQDRKDMWLNEHYQELYIEFKNLENFNLFRAMCKGKEDVPVLERHLNSLETILVRYHFECNSYFKAEMQLNNVEEIYKNSTSHLMEGYPDVYEKMVELWQAEVKYKDSLSSTLNDILKKAQELIKNNFPDLSLSSRPINNSDNSYNIVAMIQGLVIDLVKNTEDLEFDPTRGMVYTESDNTAAIAFLSQTKYDKFENNVWKPLNNEFKGKIKTLNENYNKLSKYESKFQDYIKNIISDYDSGHSIKGSCEGCNKIYNEKDIKN